MNSCIGLSCAFELLMIASLGWKNDRLGRALATSKWRESFARFLLRNVGQSPKPCAAATCADFTRSPTVTPDSTQEPHNRNIMKEEEYFVEGRRQLAIPKPIAMDIASLIVDPEAVPSKAYAETFRMLETQIKDFPNIELGRAPRPQAREVNTNHEYRRT